MRPHPGSSETVLVLVGSIAPQDVEALCARMGAAIGIGGGPIVCDVGGLEEPDVLTIDALARLQLVAIRSGRRLWLRHAPDELRKLIALLGLAGVLPLGAPLRLETVGQAEEREQCRGVQEEDDPPDLVARQVEDLEGPRLVPAPWGGLVLPERGRAVRHGRHEP